MRIDLNAAVGESYGPWVRGEDERLIPLVSSVNVACGAHAGDPLVMTRTVDLAKRHGAALGAHPGYPDRDGFGRRDLAMASAGHAADARRLVEHGRETAQRDRLQFDEPMATAPFTDAVADHVQEYTQVGGRRPYGATTLVAGVDDSGA